MAEKNSTLVKGSRYVAGGTTETNKVAIEWWERATLPRGTDGEYYIVNKAFAGRIDRIAAYFYDEPRYWWYIAQMNNILDPHNEIREGVVLWIPSKAIVADQMTGTLGGVPSKRELQTSILPIV